MVEIAVLSLVAALGGEAGEIEASAEARIREHRTREVELRLLDSEGKPLPAGTRVDVAQARHEFLFGCNIFALGRFRTPEENETYARRFAELFNYATLPFYWWNYERERGRPDYAGTERFLDATKKAGIAAKGHPLAWNWVEPRWLPKDPKEAMRLQLDRISACVERFRGAIEIWDVVNEATHYERPDPRERAPVLTRAIDEMGVGEYVRAAFRAARTANPSAVLVINDYRLDEEFERRVLKALVDEKGAPLYDAIGLQSHQHGGAIPLPRVWEVCERFAKYGKPLHWTETTFVSGEEGSDLARRRPGFRWTTTPEGEARQARCAVRFYTALFSHPAVEAITWWDFSDRGAWQGAPAGLLREDLSPKPAYEELLRLVKGAWWTRVSAEADGEGRVQFRGFFGEYRARAEAGGKTLEGTFSLRRRKPEAVVEVRLAPVT